MIIRFLVGVTQFLICLIMIVMLAGLFLLALATLDYLYNTDLKASFVRIFGKSEFMGKLRKNVEQTVDKYDTPSPEDEFIFPPAAQTRHPTEKEINDYPTALESLVDLTKENWDYWKDNEQMKEWTKTREEKNGEETKI